ncbi:amidohydrolase family protein [Roseateles sp. BYS180W]|uniref:Amidohydrolase family protein n=1 Tax=Roseateles rivi TaxID=3299028 RepID=A0ABW7FWF1_9BURK
MREWTDTHLHLLEPEHLHYDWTADFAPLQGRFGWERYAAQAQVLGITRVLHMEVDVRESQMEAESDFIAALAQTTEQPRIVGLIAPCRPEHADFPTYVARQKAQRPLVRGFRRVLHTQADELSQQAGFAQHVAQLGAQGYSYDLCVAARQLPLALALARQAPQTNIVLDHCGVPDVAGQGLDPWRQQLRELAALPHVHCKISGVIAYGRAADWTDLPSIARDLRPFVEHAIDCFGWDRVVWGSDWPVCEVTRHLSDWMGVTQLLLQGCSGDEIDRLAHRNAQRIYRLEAEA